MSNVVNLPDRAARSWPFVAEGLTTVLLEVGRDPEAVAQVIEELRPEYIAAWEGPIIEFGTDPDDALGLINDWVTSFLLRLLILTAAAKLDLREVV